MIISEAHTKVASRLRLHLQPKSKESRNSALLSTLWHKINCDEVSFLFQADKCVCF